MCYFIVLSLGWWVMQAEYVDLKTLRDRVNDAIDTIIRKEDATESGDLLQPCIEGITSQALLLLMTLFFFLSFFFC